MYSLSSTTEVVGFPIRKPPDQSLLGSSPRFIAANHVLRRLSVPRHPPYALSSLLFRLQLLTWQTQVVRICLFADLFVNFIAALLIYGM